MGGTNCFVKLFFVVVAKLEIRYFSLDSLALKFLSSQNIVATKKKTFFCGFPYSIDENEEPIYIGYIIKIVSLQYQ